MLKLLRMKWLVTNILIRINYLLRHSLYLFKYLTREYINIYVISIALDPGEMLFI